MMQLWICILLLFAAAPLARGAESAPAGAPDDPVLGTWTGTETFAGESKPIALTFELLARRNNALVVYYDNPQMRFHRYGPMPVARAGAAYTNPYFQLTLAADHASLSGKKSFDGHDLPVVLVRGTPPAQIEPAPVQVRRAEPAWTYRTAAPIWSSPALADGAVYFGGSDHVVYALRAASGAPLWQVRTGGAVMARPTVAGEHLFVPSDDGKLYKIRRRDGTIVWTADLHGNVARDLPSATSAAYDYLASAAAVSGAVVYVGSGDGRLYALAADTGALRWQFATGGSVRSTPVIDGGHVYFGSYDHAVYALDAATGALLWRRDTLEPVVSTAAVDRGTVYIGSRSSDLFALEASSGIPRWKFFYWSSWVESSPVLRDGTIYIGSSDYQQVFAIDARSGRGRWRFGSGGSPWGTPAVDGASVYVSVVGASGYFIDHRGGFFCLDRASGVPRWYFPLAPSPDAMTYGAASSPALDGARVYFGGLDGVFYAFDKQGQAESHG